MPNADARYMRETGLEGGVTTMLVLTADDVDKVLNMKVCMDALEEAYRENALDNTANRERTHIHVATSEPDRLYRFKTFEGTVVGFQVM